MGTPKALLLFNGETVLERLIRLFGASCEKVSVVLGHEPETIIEGIPRTTAARFVVNSAWQAGQLSSLQAGLRDLVDFDGVIFTPVDYPAIEAATVVALAAAMRADAGEHLIFAPRHAGRRGHPVGIRAAIAQEFQTAPPEATARDVIHRYRNRTRYVDVEDEGILLDADDPEAFRLLTERRRT